MNWFVKSLILISLTSLVCVLRFTVPGHGLTWPGIYEAFTHIFCGVLLTLGFSKDRYVRITALTCLGAASLLEIIKFALLTI